MIPPFDPIIVQFGPLVNGMPVFAVRWYAVMILTGIVLATVLAAIQAHQDGEDVNYVWDGVTIIVLCGVIGARIYHIFSEPVGGYAGWHYYLQNPEKIIAIWEGGLGIFGGIIGGLLGGLFYTRKHRLNFWQWMDYAAVGMPLAQAFGRFGNYMNRELYGPPTTVPWGLRIPAEYRIMPYTDLATYPPDTLFHPTFLYESLGSLLVFLVLFWLVTQRKPHLKRGDISLGYLIGYGVVRFGVEFLRPDAWRFSADQPLAAAQWFALALIICGSIGIILNHRWHRPEKASA